MRFELGDRHSVSYVDPVINSSVLSQVDLRAHLAVFLQLDFPERLLPTYLHEGTHHSCFMSPLGNALALLRMRAYRRATMLRTDPSGDYWTLLEDVIRQEATIELMRPLAEGIACFTELDSVPGKSNILSVPMISAYFYFDAANDEIKKSGTDVFLFSLLYRARMDPELTQRREAVLASRFDPALGGHLAGYMALKNIWNSAKKRSSAAWDSELFNTYLRSFFYDDYAFVAILLDPTKSEHNAVNAIAEYFHRRLKQLLTIDLESALQAFEESYAKGSTELDAAASVVHVAYSGLAADRDLVELGKQRLGKLIGELQRSDGFSDGEILMSRWDSIRVRKRELMCLGHLEAEVRVNEYNRVIVTAVEGNEPSEFPTFAAQCESSVPQGTGAGSLEFYLIPRDNARALAVSRGGKLVFAHIEGPVDEDRKRELKDVFGDRSLDLKIVQEQEANLEAVISENAIKIVRENLKATAPAAIEEIYLWLATLGVDQSHWTMASQALKEGGFFKLIEGDSEFLRGLAFLGVAASVAPSIEELEKTSRDRGLDLTYTIRTARSLAETKGFPTLMEFRNRILVLL